MTTLFPCKLLFPNLGCVGNWGNNFVVLRCKNDYSDGTARYRSSPEIYQGPETDQGRMTIYCFVGPQEESLTEAELEVQSEYSEQHRAAKTGLD